MAARVFKFTLSSFIAVSKAGLSTSTGSVGVFSVLARQMSSSNSLDISGIYPPIPTPFNEDEAIDWGMLKANLDKWETVPFRGYVVQGSNGEYPYLDSEERVTMVKYVKENVDAGKLIIAGSGCESTRATILMSQRMAKVGADAVLVVTPSFYKNGMTIEALVNHYSKVADKSPVPVILYSVPGNTGVDLMPEAIIRLSKHSNIIGLKDSGGDIAKLSNIIYKTKDSAFQVLAGSAGFLYPAYTVGCVGGVCALANILGKEVCDVERLFKAGQIDEVKELQQRLVSPNGAVTRRFGVPGLKQAMEWFGYYGGPTRSPLVPLHKEDVERMRQDFKGNGFL